MTAKDYLSQTWRINRMIDAKLEQVRELRELSTKATATLSDMPTSGTRNVHRMEDVICKMLDLENEIGGDIDSLVELKREITTAIKSVSNPDHKVLLELRYLAFKSWGEIATAMRYSKDYVFELHRTALSLIKIPTENATSQ